MLYICLDEIVGRGAGADQAGLALAAPAGGDPAAGGRWRGLALASLAMMALVFSGGTVEAADGDVPSACRTYSLQYAKHLEDGHVDLADKANARARSQGCYFGARATELCPVLTEIEARHEAAGRSDLANITRAKMRQIRCRF